MVQYYGKTIFLTKNSENFPISYSHKKESWLSRVQKQVANFADETSFTGIKYIFGSTKRNYVARFAWAAIFFGCVITGTVLFLPLWKSYHAGETVTVIDIEAKASAKFPSVTLCNLNKWRKSVIGHHYDQYVGLLGHNPTPRYGKHPACHAPKLSEVYPELSGNKTLEMMYTSFRNFSVSFGYWAYLIASPSIYQSVIQCKFRGRFLSDSECYSSFMNTAIQDGLCFMFNPSNETRFAATKLEVKTAQYIPTFPNSVSGKIEFETDIPGQNGAIELLLNVQQYEYCAMGQSDAVGFEMKIHSRQTHLRPIMLGLSNDVIRLQPGQEITASIQKVKYSRETEAFGRCLRKIKYNYYKSFDEYYKEACMNDCITKVIKDKCNCISQFAPPELYAEVQRNASKMEVHEIELMCIRPDHSACVRDHMSSGKTLKSCAYCKTGCETIEYAVQLTYSMFPASNTFHIYKSLKYPRVNYSAIRALVQKDSSMDETIDFAEYIDPWSRKVGPPDFKTISEVRENILLLRLQYSTLSVRTITEKLSTKISDMVSQFGGLLGLFVGASIISFIELFFWIIICMRSVVY